MSGLVLKLSPKERLLVNGAVVENGDRRTRLSILTPDAKVLRLRDALHPTEANTPVRSVCYILQLVLSGDVELSEARHQVVRGIEQLSHVLRDPQSSLALNQATDFILEAKIYPALKALRTLLPREDRLLSGTTR